MAAHLDRRSVVDLDRRDRQLGDAAVLDGQGGTLDRPIDERRHDVAPDGRHRAAPVAGTQDLALSLAKRSELRDDLEEKFPTAALASFEFEGESWRDLSNKTARLMKRRKQY